MNLHSTPVSNSLSAADASAASDVTANPDVAGPDVRPVTRKRSLTMTLVAVLTALVATLLPATAAHAETGLTRTGVTGSIREQSVPATCYNSGYGYYIRVAGPAAWGRNLTNGETSQYIKWGAWVYDYTQHRYVESSGWSNWSVASQSRGVQFDNDLIRTAGRGDVFGVVVVLDWYSSSYKEVIGQAQYVVSSYYIADQARYASHC